MKRKRRLTEAELDLWRSVNNETIPLSNDALDTHQEAVPIIPEIAYIKPQKPAFSVKRETIKPTSQQIYRRPEIDILAPVAAGIDRKTSDRLRKGKTPPQARLDLHGMTVQRAHGALLSFVNSSHSKGLRCILVITGKGAPQDRHAPFQMENRRGILRESVPKWLQNPEVSPKIVGLYQAHQSHGGDGAYYIYLKKQR